MSANDQQQFEQLAKQGAKRVPVMRTMPVQDRSSVRIYSAIADQPNSCLLESAKVGGTAWSRYSIIVPPARRTITIDGGAAAISRGEKDQQRLAGNPYAHLRNLWSQHAAPRIPGLPPFYGGLVGYFAYDTVRYGERRLSSSAPASHPLQTPDILLLVADRLIAFDRQENLIKLVALADPAENDAYSRAQATLDELQQQVQDAPPGGEELPELPPDDPAGHAIEQEASSNFSEHQYAQVVQRIREYILAGDAMQVVPSRRAELELGCHPFTFYRALRQVNPSPYMYYFNFGNFQVAGSSPEILVRLRDGTVTTRPIAGTRRRGRTPDEDRKLAQEMLDDPKERAEHIMLIDLGRNDVGKIARTGSVKLVENMQVENFSHVMHIVSTVEGQLASGDALDVLRSVLPAGTLSGAPKSRAMEIIDEVEPVRRGIYGGAVGYLASSGDMDAAVAIRTAVIRNGNIHIQAGGGIVADSDPHKEWLETENKARAMFRSIALARNARSKGLAL